jgi:hypothetical protein
MQSSGTLTSRSANQQQPPQFGNQNNRRDTRQQWTVEDFCNIQNIGSGKFGKVFRATEKNSNKTVALKVVVKSTLEKFDFFT